MAGGDARALELALEKQRWAQRFYERAAPDRMTRQVERQRDRVVKAGKVARPVKRRRRKQKADDREWGNVRRSINRVRNLVRRLNGQDAELGRTFKELG